MQRRKFVTAVLFALAVLGTSSAALAKEPNGFLSAGAVVNRSRGLMDVSRPVLPHLALEVMYPAGGGPVSAGFEISALIYRNDTERFGSETNFGFLAGTVLALELDERWSVSTGLGLILSNPLSDAASGGYLDGNEGDPSAQLVRAPAERMCISGAVRYRVTPAFALQFGVRDTSPYASFGIVF